MVFREEVDCGGDIGVGEGSVNEAYPSTAGKWACIPAPRCPSPVPRPKLDRVSRSQSRIRSDICCSRTFCSCSPCLLLRDHQELFKMLGAELWPTVGHRQTLGAQRDPGVGRIGRSWRWVLTEHTPPAASRPWTFQGGWASYRE